MKKQLTKLASIGLMMAAGSLASFAGVLTWDPGLTGGSTGGSGGNGTWNLNSSANWWNSTSDVPWTDNSTWGNDTAIFAGNAGTVTLNTSLSSSNLQFTTSGYTLSGSGTLTVGSGGVNASSLSSGTTTIGTAVAIPGVQEPWQVGAGSALGFNGALMRGVGGGVDFTVPGVTTTSIANDPSGMVDGWATTGNYFASASTGDFLSVSNDVLVVCTNYLDVSPTSSTTLSTSAVTGQNLVSGALNGANEISTVSANVTVNSLIQQGDFSVGNGVTLTIASGGLIQRGVSRWLLDNGGGNLGTAVLLSGLPSGEFFIHSPNGGANVRANSSSAGNWRIWPQIHDNGSTPCIVVKDGPGCVSLQNTNSYTGGTIINNGILTAGANLNNLQFGHTLGFGPITINSPGIMEIGFGTANANLDYYYTNTVDLNGGAVLSDDAHNHLSGPVNVLAGGATFGSTYDGGGSSTTGNKQMFIDGLVSGSGPIYLEDAYQAGECDYYGNAGGNAFNSSVVAFSNNGNTYSGTIAVVPYSVGSAAGSYLAVNGSTALQNATVDVENNTGGQRYAGSGGVYTSLIFNTGLGSATLGALTGGGNVILNGFNENTYALGTDAIALTVGGNNTSTTNTGSIIGSGSLTKVGSGTQGLAGALAYTGNTTVGGGTLSLQDTFVGSTNITVGAGATLDVSGLGSVTLAGYQSLHSAGTVNGSLSTSAGSAIYADSGSGYGTNAVNGSLNLASGSVVYFNIGTLAVGSNDLLMVSGTLSANNNVIHLKAPSTSAALQTTDYLLITSANAISGSFSTAPSWDVQPSNAGNFSIVTSGNTVKLHYTASTAPAGGGVATPNPAVRNQTVFISVTATNGTGGTVNSVVVDASAIGGSSTLSLISAGGNVWTNSVPVAAATGAGGVILVATLTDTANLTAIVNIPLTVSTANDVWNGGGLDSNFSDNLNWTNQTAPGLLGDSLEFAGSTDLTPNMDNSYTITGITFDSGAGSFNIGGGNTLTLSGGSIVNNSANAQTLNVVVADSGGGITKTGSGLVTLAGNNTYTGRTIINGGALGISGSLASTANVLVGNAAGDSVLDISGTLSPYYLIVGDITNAVGAVYQTGGTVTATSSSGYDNLILGNLPGTFGYYSASGGTLDVNGIAVAGEVNNGTSSSFGLAGNGILEVNGATVTDPGWFVIARNNNSTAGHEIGIVNVYSGSLSFAGGGMVGPWDTGESAIINVLGGSINSTANVGVYLGNTGYEGILNLDGGLVEASTITGYNGPGYAPVTGGFLNFNGGTAQAYESTTTFIQVNAATVYKGGGIIDNNGNTITVAQALVAPTGNGIYAASVTSGGSGYVAPPIITITNAPGDTTGSGATAIAQINPLTGMVTNVIVTCPGQGYTATPVFVLSGGGAATPAVITGAAPSANLSGGLTSTGSGELTLSGLNTYLGATVVSNGLLALTGSLDSTNVITESGATFDVSGLASYTLAAGQSLSGWGNVNGTVNASAGASIFGGTDGTYGTNTIANLQLAAGATVNLDLGTSATGANDQIAVSGTLVANNNSIHIKAPSTSSSLDGTADYVLITAGSISGTFNSAPVWDVSPLNAGNFSVVVTNGNEVVLHYTSTSAPTATGSASPSTVLRSQATVITVNVTPGSGSINPNGGVVLDLSPLGGTSVTLVRSNTSSLYTNTIVIPSTAAPGNITLTATVTDSTPLTGSAAVALNIVTSTEVWDGAGANQNWDTSPNWASGAAPGLVGDSVVFAGAAGLAPNMDNNYSVASLTFSNNAGSFNIGSANNSSLTISSGGVVNNSASAQTIGVPVTLTSVQSINAASGDITISGALTDNGSGLSKTGTHALTLSGNNTITGPALIAAGTLNLAGSASPSYTTVGSAAGNAVMNLSGSSSLTAANLFVGNVGGAVSAVYQTGGTVNLSGGTGDLLNLGNWTGSYGYYNASGGTINVNGISIGGESNPNVWPPQGTGDGILDVNGATINNVGWIVLARGGGPNTGILNMWSGSLTFAGGGLACNWELSDEDQTSIINVMGGTLSSTTQGVYFRSTDVGILNLNGGVLSTTTVNGPGTVDFNGGTLQATAAGGSFLSANAAYVYGGGATIDNNGNAITIAEPLLAPTGNGVHGIGSFTGGAGYIAPPVIIVTNDPSDTTGTGATAVAQINPLTGTVTNVIITCPGVNYTATPKFLVSDGGATVPATITGIAPTPNTSGGLTAIGSAVTTLSPGNTYTGNTTVSGGTLELPNATLATGSTVTIASGAVLQLDFSGTNQVGALVLNGVTQATGVYNRTTAAGYITGAGSLLVGAPIASNPTNMLFSVSGNTLKITWPADHLGWILQAQTNSMNTGLSANWVDVAGSSASTTNVITINPANPTVFYRLRHP